MAIIRIRNENTSTVAIYSEAVGYGRTTNYTKTGNGGASSQYYNIQAGTRQGYTGNAYGYTYQVDTKSTIYPPIVLVKISPSYYVHCGTPRLVSGTTWAFEILSFEAGYTYGIQGMRAIEPVIYVYTPYHQNAGDATNAHMILRNNAGDMTFSDVRQTLFMSGSFTIPGGSGISQNNISWPNEVFPAIPFATGSGLYNIYTPNSYEAVEDGVYGLSCNASGNLLYKTRMTVNKYTYEDTGGDNTGGTDTITVSYLKTSLIV